jgi:NAD(P)-dependent dehydrogenase (short-subunit alcohol dehydrogenase family)
VNLHSVGYGVSTFVPHLLTHGDGHVVITASVAGHTSSPRLGIYNASKHGAVTIAETLHNELKDAGETIGVTCLCPGIVNTQILEADRNRPELMSDPGMARELTEEQEVRLAMVKEVFGQAKPPEEVADLVHDAVLAEQFWLFTDDEFIDPITARHRDIATRQNPSHTGALTDVATGDAT